MTLELAIKCAHLNPIEGRGKNSISRMAAVLTYDNYYTFIGYNQYKTHPLQARYGYNKDAIYLHAEIDAIRQAVAYLQDDNLCRYSMYVARILANGTTALAKPCSGCTKAIKEFNIKYLEWTR